MLSSENVKRATNQIFEIIIDCAGIRFPLYVSSFIEECGTPEKPIQINYNERINSEMT